MLFHPRALQRRLGRILQQLGVVTRKHHEAIHPRRIAQLRATQQQLIRPDGTRCLARHVQRPIKRVQAVVRRLARQRAAQRRNARRRHQRRRQRQRLLHLEIRLAVQVRRLHIRQPLRLTAAQQHEVRGKKLVPRHPHNVADTHLAPRPRHPRPAAHVEHRHEVRIHLHVRRVPLPVLRDFLRGRNQQHDRQRHERRPPVRRRHARDLLDTPDEQEEQIRILRKLLHQKHRHKRHEIVLVRHHLVAVIVVVHVRGGIVQHDRALVVTDRQAAPRAQLTAQTVPQRQQLPLRIGQQQPQQLRTARRRRGWPPRRLALRLWRRRRRPSRRRLDRIVVVIRLDPLARADGTHGYIVDPVLLVPQHVIGRRRLRHAQHRRAIIGRRLHVIAIEQIHIIVQRREHMRRLVPTPRRPKERLGLVVVHSEPRHRTPDATPSDYVRYTEAHATRPWPLPMDDARSEARRPARDGERQRGRRMLGLLNATLAQARERSRAPHGPREQAAAVLVSRHAHAAQHATRAPRGRRSRRYGSRTQRTASAAVRR